MGRFLSFGRSPKPAAETPGTPENLQLDELLLFSEDSLPVSLLKHNPDNQSRALKMFQSVLQYMGVHGEMLGAMQALELAQKLLHQVRAAGGGAWVGAAWGALRGQAAGTKDSQNAAACPVPPCPLAAALTRGSCPCAPLQGLKRVELRDELFMQLVKQTRGNPNPAARAKAWQLFYLTAATMPPSKDFMGLVSGEGAGVGGSCACRGRHAGMLEGACLGVASPAARSCALHCRRLTRPSPAWCALQSTCTRARTTRRRWRRCGTWPPRRGTP